MTSSTGACRCDAADELHSATDVVAHHTTSGPTAHGTTGHVSAGSVAAQSYDAGLMSADVSYAQNVAGDADAEAALSRNDIIATSSVNYSPSDALTAPSIVESRSHMHLRSKTCR